MKELEGGAIFYEFDQRILHVSSICISLPFITWPQGAARKQKNGLFTQFIICLANDHFTL